MDGIFFYMMKDITFLRIEISDVSNFLSGEEDSCFIEEEIEEMWGEYSRMIRVELCNMLIEEVEALNPFAIHLQFGFVEDLIRFVFPIHEVTKTKSIKI